MIVITTLIIVLFVICIRYNPKIDKVYHNGETNIILWYDDYKSGHFKRCYKIIIRM